MITIFTLTTKVFFVQEQFGTSSPDNQPTAPEVPQREAQTNTENQQLGSSDIEASQMTTQVEVQQPRIQNTNQQQMG